MDTVSNVWVQAVRASNSAQVISSKFKNLRRTLKQWSRNISSLPKLITNCNLVIAFLDSLGELRNLFTQESNFRILIKGHLQKLLHMQKEYWRQRYTQRFFQLGDENTKFFHSMATERYRRNTISQILNPDGRMVSDHQEKSALFWQEFKNRLGVSPNIEILFDLEDLISPVEGLEELVLTFSSEEIDSVILSMANDKAPEPDGFNSLLRKVGISSEMTSMIYAGTFIIIMLT